MFPDRHHGTRLGSFFTFTLVKDETDFVAFREMVETIADHGVPVHVDFVAVTGLYETVAFRLEKTGYAPVVRRLMGLDVASHGAGVVLELAARRVEGIADGDENVLMRMVFGRIALDDDLSSRNGQIDSQMVQVALVATRARFHYDVAGHDPSEKAVKGSGMLANMGLDRRRRRHLAEGDLDWELHMLLTASRRAKLDQCALIYISDSPREPRRRNGSLEGHCAVSMTQGRVVCSAGDPAEWVRTNARLPI